jgi:D-alanine transaminase
MSRVAYVDRQDLPHCAAAVHIEDRGHQFADPEPHLARLRRSLFELRPTGPRCDAAMKIILGEDIRRYRVRHGVLYLTRTTVNLPTIVRIDGVSVSTGEPGPLTHGLEGVYTAHTAVAT